MARLGFISPLDFDVERLKKLVRENGKLSFSTNDQDWLTEQSGNEEIACKAVNAIINAIDDDLKILVNERDYYLLEKF